jgi:antitoxin CptB
MQEPPEFRLKRLRMRSWRRGTKEMDLILGPYSDAHLGSLGPAELDDYEALLGENDQDLYPWISGAVACPARHAGTVARVGAYLSARAGE